MTNPNRCYLIPTYLPEVGFFAKVNQASNQSVVLSTNIPWRKQSRLNRTYIKTANGLQALAVPVSHGVTLFCEAVIHPPDRDWLRYTLRALETAYRKTAFFDVIMPDVNLIYQNYGRPGSLLLELNLALINYALKLLNLSGKLTNNPEVKNSIRLQDLDSQLYKFYRADERLKPYYQPFGNFVSNLSILDLLFNMGPESKQFLVSND